MVLSALYLASATSLITVSAVEPSHYKGMTRTRLNLSIQMIVGCSPTIMGFFWILELQFIVLKLPSNTCHLECQLTCVFSSSHITLHVNF